MWEAFSYQIAGAGSLPPLTDLLLVATPGAGVQELPWLRRTGTGTDVYGLDGCEGNLEFFLKSMSNNS